MLYIDVTIYEYENKLVNTAYLRHNRQLFMNTVFAHIAYSFNPNITLETAVCIFRQGKLGRLTALSLSAEGTRENDILLS